MKTYRSSSDFLMRNIAGDNVLIKIVNNGCGNTNVFVFNDSGTFLWMNLAENKSKTQLVALLREKYNIEEAQAESDVDVFLSKAITEGFITEEEEA